jgi:hypothetical protein
MIPPLLYSIKAYSITAGTPSAAAILAHDELALLQIGLGNSADASGLVVGVLLDDTTQAAQLFEPCLLPLRNQRSICIFLIQQKLVQFPRNFLLLIEQVVDVPTPLMMDLRNLPKPLSLPLSIHRRMLSILHLQRKLVQHRQNGLKTFRRFFGLQGSYLRHGLIYYKNDLLPLLDWIMLIISQKSNPFRVVGKIDSMIEYIRKIRRISLMLSYLVNRHYHLLTKELPE